MARIPTVAAALLLLPAVAAAQTRPAGVDEEARQMAELLAEARSFADGELAGLTPAEGVDPRSAVTARLDGEGFIVVETGYALPGGDSRFASHLLPLDDGAARVRLARGMGGEAGEATMLDVLRPLVGTEQTLREPGGLVSGFTGLTAGPEPGAVRLQQAVERVDGSLNVFLFQRSPEPADDGPAVSLRVNFDPADPAAAADETGPLLVEAASVAELRRRDRAAFDRYVLPMFRDLGLRNLVDAETRASATQLFLAKLPADDATREAARAAVARLGSPVYAERRAAQAELETLGRPGATALLTIDPAALTAEQRSRVGQAVDAYRPLSPDRAAALLDDPAFLRDVADLSGEPDDDALAELARQRLAELVD